MSEERKGDGWWVVTFVVGVLGLIMGVVGIAIASGKSNGATAAAAAPASGGTTEFDITLADISVSPSMIEIPAGEVITLHVTNAGTLEHDFKVMGDNGLGFLKAGESADLQIGPLSADTEVWCTVPGHQAAGMTMAVHVLGGASSGSSSGGANAPVDDSAKIDGAAMPTDGWEGRDPVLAPALTGTVHEIAFDAVETIMEVAPGVTQQMWSFNGQVPGPTLHGKVGDTFRITLTNKGSMGHSIDFHASQTAMNHQMVEIKPGETFTYTFTADYAGVWMYHCGTAPALLHIANGMFGMVIVEPKGGLPKVDNEFAFVQSEWYLGAQGQPSDYAKANQTAPAPDFVVFNGIANQYKDNPVAVKTGGRVRVFVLDAGPNEDSSYHVVGTIFDNVIKEGIELRRGNAGGWGSQAVDLSPAQGAIIEFTPTEDGMFPFVTHAFNFATHGAIGIFMAGDGDPLN